MNTVGVEIRVAEKMDEYTISVNVTKESRQYNHSWLVYAGLTQWPVWGGNLHNTHDVEKEVKINRDNVGRLEPKWVFKTRGNLKGLRCMLSTTLTQI